MSEKKHVRRDRFSWGAGDVEIIKAPDTKPAREEASPAVEKSDAATNERSLSPQGKVQGGAKKD